MKKQLRFSHGERLVLKYLYEHGYSNPHIANRLRRSTATINNELHRGYTNVQMPNGRPVYSIEKAEIVCRHRTSSESKKIVETQEMVDTVNKIIEIENSLDDDFLLPHELLLLYRSLNPGNQIQKNDE